ncbi:hypothetical protein CTI12_AA316100 [Artemisia annua]|uniref:Uncharacterized protein n=1 Tax=Artemisia annua TaxID=35608 RepID=A0A2U1N2X3_ARTAN|nr:hypothetical protein CTI12_AA316100 [Artemisia annua]
MSVSNFKGYVSLLAIAGACSFVTQATSFPLIEADKKKNKENGFVDDPTVDFHKMYTDLRKYGTEFGVSSQHSKGLCKLKREAIAIKEHLKTILNSNNKKDISSLLRSIEDVIQIVTHFYNETRDVPYNWMRRRFITELKRGTKIVYPKAKTVEQPDHDLKFRYADESDEDSEAECKDVTTDPTNFQLDSLDARIHMVVSQVGLDGLFATIPNVCYPNKIEEKIWKEFEDFDKENYEVDLLMPYGVEPVSIEVDHPIVPAIGNFAVKAFNKACEMHVKKGEHYNLHDFELIECKYIKTAISYYFYMVIEAFEEGNLGIYEARVICNIFGGEMILCQFVLTDRKPFGTKAMSGKYFECLQFICEAVENLYLEKLTRLKALSKSLGGLGANWHDPYLVTESSLEGMGFSLFQCHFGQCTGDERSKAKVYKDLLKHQHTEAVEGLKCAIYTTALHRRLNSWKRTRLPDCNQKTNPGYTTYRLILIFESIVSLSSAFSYRYTDIVYDLKQRELMQQGNKLICL